MNSWDFIIKKMDGSGPPLKKQIIRKNNPKLSKTTTDSKTQDIQVYSSDFFDINIHGYRLVKGSLMYRTPDGKLLPATGVDSFGPFKDPPKTWGFKPFPAAPHRRQ
jgi:hypothetical protein